MYKRQGDVYTLDTEGLAVDGPLADGAMVEVGFDGMILETYPAKFGHVTGVTVLEGRLDRHTFVRISHSEIISLRKITALDLSLTGTIRVTLEGGAVSYVSRRYVRKIKEALGL